MGEFRDPHHARRENTTEPSYFGLCQACGATGSWKQSYHDALEAWNARVDYWRGPDPNDMYTVLTDVVAPEPWTTEGACWWCGNEQEDGHRADCTWVLTHAVLSGFHVSR